MTRFTLPAAVTLFCVTTPAAGAQAAAGSAECFGRIPESELVRVPVHLEAEPRDSAGQALLPLVDALVELSAVHVRRSLNAGPGPLPDGEPRVTWRTLGNGLVVHVHRDGSLTSSPRPAGSQAAHTPPPGTLLLEDALSAIRNSGEKIFVPEDSGADSLGFLIVWRVPTATAGGGLQPMPVRRAVPVFSLGVPREQPARALRGPRISYPERPRGSNAQGTVILSFVVDAGGRPEENTVNAYWPPDRPPLRGELGEYYRLFVSAARRGVRSMRFEPARLGGCPVRQLVHLPIDFMLTR
jgi:hypothetical protein